MTEPKWNRRDNQTDRQGRTYQGRNRRSARCHARGNQVRGAGRIGGPHPCLCSISNTNTPFSGAARPLPDSRLAPQRGTQKPAARGLSWSDCTLTRLTLQVSPTTSDPVDSESDPRLPASDHRHAPSRCIRPAQSTGGVLPTSPVARRDGPTRVTTCGSRRSGPREQHSTTVSAPHHEL